MRAKGSRTCSRKRREGSLGLGPFLVLSLAGALGAAESGGSGGIVTARTSKSNTDLAVTSSSATVVPVSSKIATYGAIEVEGTQSKVDALRPVLTVSGPDYVVVDDSAQILSTGTNYQLSMPVSGVSGLSLSFTGGPLALASDGSGGVVTLTNSGSSTSSVSSGAPLSLDVSQILANPFSSYVLTIRSSDQLQMATVTMESDG